jgi:hypothetical protein
VDLRLAFSLAGGSLLAIAAGWVLGIQWLLAGTDGNQA